MKKNGKRAYDTRAILCSSISWLKLRTKNRSNIKSYFKISIYSLSLWFCFFFIYSIILYQKASRSVYWCHVIWTIMCYALLIFINIKYLLITSFSGLYWLIFINIKLFLFSRTRSKTQKRHHESTTNWLIIMERYYFFSSFLLFSCHA
jgi:hypothetical protein